MYDPGKYPTLASIAQATDLNDAVAEYILINDTFTSPHQKLMLAILLTSELMMVLEKDDRFSDRYVPQFIEDGAREFARYVKDTEYLLSDEVLKLLKDLQIDRSEAHSGNKDDDVD